MKISNSVIFLLTLICPLTCQSMTIQEFYREYSQDKTVKELYWPAIAYAVEQGYDEIAFEIFAKDPYIVPYKIPKGFVSNINIDKINIIESLLLKGKLCLLREIINIYLNGGQKNVDDLPETKLTLLELAILLSEESDVIERAEFVISLGVNLDRGMIASPLGWAIYKNRKDIATILLINGASPNGGNYWHDQALEVAIQENNYVSVVLLVSFGAKVNYSLVEQAVAKGNVEILDLLVNMYYAK